jgi:hypothetical protein
MPSQGITPTLSSKSNERIPMLATVVVVVVDDDDVHHFALSL